MMAQGFLDEADFTPITGDIANSAIVDFCRWIPDLSQPWQINYDTSGPTQITQSWIAPSTATLGKTARCLVSWNREPFKTLTGFQDDGNIFLIWGENSGLDRTFVPVSVSLTPLLDDFDPSKGYEHAAPGQAYVKMTSPYLASEMLSNAVSPCSGKALRHIFPSVNAAKYRVDVTWAPDEFVNRFGVRYAKIEIEPTIRMESITGASLGVVKVKDDGTINLDPAGAPQADERITTGFPSREAQILMKVTYPWVRLGGDGGQQVLPYSILKAGPIGRTLGVPKLLPGQVPEGQYLGCVNDDWFLGFPRGRVLYQSATLVEKRSPVTGKLGYQITHDFLCLSNSEWNQVRMQKIDDNAAINPAADASTAQWPYGYTVATDKNGKIILTGAVPPAIGVPIYPYVYKDFEELLYYGYLTDFQSFTDEA